jgi:hypothetical protein
MKRPLFLLFSALAAAFVVLGSVGCEQHPLKDNPQHGTESDKDQKATGH